MSIRVHIEVQDEEVLSCFDVVEHSDVTEDVDAATLARLIDTAQCKANALLPPAPSASTDDAAEGVKVGTAYIEVRPRFSGFDGDEFEQAVERVVARITPFKGAFSHGARRAFRP